MRLRMDKPIYGGASLGRIDATEDLAGKAVFVPMALPGELVDVHVVKDHRSYLQAELRGIVEPAPQRIPPGCEYYGTCGGCQYQHTGYATQLAMKHAILRETLERARLTLPATIATIAGEPWGYRSRVRLHVARSVSPPSLAFRERASSRDLPVGHCPIAAPLLTRAIAAFNAWLATDPAHSAHLDEVELCTNAEESALLVAVSSSQQAPQDQLPHHIARALQLTVPECTGVRVTGTQPPQTNAAASHARHRSRRPRPAPAPQSWSQHWGKLALTYTVGGSALRVTSGSFFQVNRFLVPHLVQHVVAGRQGGIAWDLYAGVGLFAQALLPRYQRIVAVESAPASAADLAHNLRGTNARAVAVDTRRFLEARNAPRPDLAIVDPPRAGLGAEVCRLLAAAQPRTLVYVSCDPATLARDLRALQPSGYRLASLTLIDLFPQTFHLETIATLERD